MEQQEERRNGGRLEHLEEEVARLTRESRDYYFTEYLQKLMGRVRDQKYQVDLLQNELEHSYQLYLQRNYPGQNPGQLGQNTGQNPGQNPGFSFGQTNAEQSVPNMAPYTAAPFGTVSQGPYGIGQNIEYRQAAPARKKNTEFTVGTAVFSVIGVAFILTAFVMFGMNFMNGFVKGMTLYAMSAVLLLVSETVLWRRNEKIAMAITAIGVGGLYLSTVLNYLYLHNFGGTAAMLITAAVTAGVLLLSRKKESGLLRVIGMIACYLCFLPIQEGIGNWEFMVITGILFGINIMCALLPVKKAVFSLGLTHMVSNAVFSELLLWRAAWFEVGSGFQAVFAISSFIILNLVFFLLLSAWDNTKENKSYDRTGMVTAYCISAFLFVTMFVFVIYQAGSGAVGLRHGSVAALAVICLVFFLLQTGRPERWLQYFTCNIAAFLVYGLTDNILEGVVCVLVMLALAKLLTRVPLLRFSEYSITAFVCFVAIIFSDGPYFYVFTAGVVLSILFIHRWQTAYEIMIVWTLALLAVIKLPPMLKLPGAVGISLIGILLFYNVPRWKGKGIKGFHFCMLSGQGICYLMLANRIYTGAYITYLMMLIFGLATMILTFHEKYDMDYKGKHLILAIFLTYMALVCRLRNPVLTSILLMLVALVSVGAGFAIRERSVRIYGLVLSLLVCGKVVLYDFVGAPNLQKMILFFVLGVLALVISGIYILLEKKWGGAEKPETKSVSNY